MRRRDDGSFEEFVLARGSALLRTAYLVCGSRHDAEDLLQAALEKAYRHWSRIEADHSPEPYVRRILVNAAIGRTRRRKVLREVRMAAPPEESTASATDAVDLRDALLGELRDALLGELRRLPARQRAVLVLRYWEDLSEAETATVLGCGPGTVKSQASRALAKLRERISAETMVPTGIEQGVNHGR